MGPYQTLLATVVARFGYSKIELRRGDPVGVKKITGLRTRIGTSGNPWYISVYFGEGIF